MKTTKPPAVIISISMLLFLGCSSTQVKQHAFEEYLDGGIPIAANRGGPKFDEDLFRFEKVLTLHQDDDRPESFLYQTNMFLRTERGFFLGEDGSFYVCDSGNTRIAVFDSTGRFQRAIGQRGQGPGEFMLCELYELSDGILKIIDHNLHRITYYRTDGALIETVHARGFPHQEHDLIVMLGGSSHYDENEYLWMGAGFVATTTESDTFGIARTGEVQILYSFATPGHGKGGRSRPPIPFIERPFALYVSDGSVLLTDGVEPVLWWYWLDGTVRKQINLGIPKRPATDEDIRRFYRDLDEQLATADDNQRVYLGWMRDAVFFPEYRTLWSRIFVDDAGYLWLEGFEMDFERRDQGGGFTYYLLSPDGEYLGTTRAPATGRVMYGHFMGEFIDYETDQEEYAVWRIIPQKEDFIYP